MKKLISLVFFLVVYPCLGEEKVQTMNNFCSPISIGQDGRPRPWESCTTVIAICGRWGMPGLAFYGQQLDNFYPSTEQGQGFAFGYYLSDFQAAKISATTTGVSVFFSNVQVVTRHSFKLTIQFMFNGQFVVAAGVNAQAQTSINRDMYWYFSA